MNYSKAIKYIGRTAGRVAISMLFTAIPTGMFAQNEAPVLTAAGEQIYCQGSPLNIVADFNITDEDDSGTAAVYIQISEGYVAGQDFLTLTGTHPGITTSWDAVAGKLTISGSGGGDVPYDDLIAATEDVMYNNTAIDPVSGTRTFSITIGQANYLPSTGHYYMFVPNINISWSSAETTAENSTYYGLQGYLATLTTADEAQLCGEQATGTGWIGGNDAAQEGVWKWVTGPEAGMTFWNGVWTGSTPNYAFWNNSEPNDTGGNEDYAHITAPGVGIPGSWNDLPNIGGNGDYQAMGYIVEYGGMPGDPVLQISATSAITVVEVTSAIDGEACSGSTTTLEAAASGGATVYWYADAAGGAPIATGSSFITPPLTATTSYYVSPFDGDCDTERTEVTAFINDLPTITIAEPAPVCGQDSTTLEATPSAGTVTWYSQPEGGTALGSGTTFTTPVLTGDTTYYAEASNNGCLSEREAVTVLLLDTPIVADETITFCANEQTTLQAGLTDVTYEWSTGEDTPSIDITEAGTYTVTVTNAAGCDAVKTFTVSTITAPEIIEIATNKNTATVIMADPAASYEYSLDGGNYQDSNVFTELEAGPHIVQVRSLIGCGSDSESFVIYLIPNYFSPNSDSVNDEFTIGGMFHLPLATISIYDRYGKLITFLNHRNRTWDGTHNGKPLPATDYWYIIKINDKTPEIRGHFSLIR